MKEKIFCTFLRKKIEVTFFKQLVSALALSEIYHVNMTLIKFIGTFWNTLKIVTSLFVVIYILCGTVKK